MTVIDVEVLKKHLKSLQFDFKHPADALKDSDWLFHPICELFRKDIG